MSLTIEQLAKWRSIIADGKTGLDAYLASPEGQADSELVYLAKVSSGLADGLKILRVIEVKRRIRDIANEKTALTAQSQALTAEAAALIAELTP